ncbi:MAG: DUF4249 domain-containing protein [Bacteroidales bacterium]|nr:DUF4249 domain-containing protein [Bacteroidales bacterium]
MRKYYTLLVSAFIASIIFTSCIDEDFKIDVPEGERLVGINGYFTTEYKKHEIVISKTADFYSDEEIEMISGAEVFIHDGTDTIYFEETENKGHYQTIDSVAGIIGKTYLLDVTFVDNEGEHKFFSESKIRENTPQIDSMAIKKVSNNFFPGVNDTAVNLYPYFQTVNDPETNYLINIVVNDTTYYGISFLEFKTLSLKGLSGMYFNGPEMVSKIGEQSIHTIETISYYDDETGYSYGWPMINKGDKITVLLYSITPEFMKYYSDVLFSFGSNPMMGTPYNVSTNIQPFGKAVGFFGTASVVSASIIY